MRHNTYTIHNTNSLRYFMNEAYDALPVPKAILPAFAEVLELLDDADYNGAAGITVEKETFDKVAAFISTTAQFKMRQTTQALRDVKAISPDELRRLRYESPKMLEDYFQGVQKAQAAFRRAMNFNKALHRRVVVRVPRASAVEKVAEKTCP